MSTNRLVVLVNGLPGAGKSTLAHPLARELGVPLFGKDLIKETWADVLGSFPPDERPQHEWNALFGAAASQTIWNLLAQSSCGGVVDSALPGRSRRYVEAGLAQAGVTPTTGDLV
ncbi:AAA family ATPase [Actinopolymorpha rutila]|uniref:Putative kinase n=1 Tax=Actinopolymorpha rutila TaxID=446787 RepID=A0A852ZGE6_9ACTN|nr:AAA family ATPase [Actinopolymorpha rutila]NYH88699.1 putative kinase [Actinopolymorpha rutila]